MARELRGWVQILGQKATYTERGPVMPLKAGNRFNPGLADADPQAAERLRQKVQSSDILARKRIISVFV